MVTKANLAKLGWGLELRAQIRAKLTLLSFNPQYFLHFISHTKRYLLYGDVFILPSEFPLLKDSDTTWFVFIYIQHQGSQPLTLLYWRIMMETNHENYRHYSHIRSHLCHAIIGVRILILCWARKPYSNSFLPGWNRPGIFRTHKVSSAPIRLTASRDISAFSLSC